MTLHTMGTEGKAGDVLKEQENGKYNHLFFEFYHTPLLLLFV